MSERDEMAEAFEQSRHYFCGESPGDRAVNWLIWKDAWQAARAAQAVQTLTDERILAVVDACFDQGYYEVSNRDWITFARAILAAPQPSPEPKEPEHEHDWRFSLQDHVYKCDCGETRGDYPFGAASFKD